VTTRALAAVGGTGRETSVALAADHLVAVVGRGEDAERRLNDTTTETEDQVEGRLLLDVVIRKGAAILELLSGEDETLLVWGDTFLVLDLGLDVVDGVGRLNLEGDRLSREGLYEDLHTTSESAYQVESGLLLNIVVREGSAVFELLSGEDKSLLIRWDTFLVLDLGLDVFNGV